jgi:hypothetical protein
MKDLIKAIDNLPQIVKLILCIPMLDIVWTVYRLLRSLVANNMVGIVVSIILFFCAPFVWLIDLICIILNKKVWWFC